MGLNHQRPISSTQAREIDRLAIEVANISGLELMERAGTRAAEFLIRENSPGTTLIACGTGNNGGDGFVIARYLKSAGFHVSVWLVGQMDRMTSNCKVNFERWKKTGGTTLSIPEVDSIPVRSEPWNMIIDCLLGTGSRGDPREPLASVIRELNRMPASLRVAIDLPSGLDCDTGVLGDPTLQADLTLTIVAKKKGFQSETAQAVLGRVAVIELDLPDWIFEFGLG